MIIEHISDTATDITILVLIIIAFGDRAINAFNFIFDKFSKKNNPTNRLQKFQEKSKKVSAILEVYRAKHSAARASFSVFHNGGHDIANIPFLKCSCIDEIIAKGVSATMSDFQGIHLYVMVDWLEQFLQNSVVIEDINSIKSESIKALLTSKRVEYKILAPVWNNRELVGYVSLEWCCRKYIPKNINKIINDILELSKIIEIERYR